MKKIDMDQRDAALWGSPYVLIVPSTSGRTELPGRETGGAHSGKSAARARDHT